MAKVNNIPLVEEMISLGYISKRKHPVYDLYILNYTKSCQMNHVWNEATCACRGMIVDGDWNIVARPFKKFFNVEELQNKDEIPEGMDFRVFEKKDGSLGILYWDEDCHPHIATRGSFESDQSIVATKYLINNVLSVDDECELRELLLDFKDTDDGDKLVRVKKTLLFEIVYPEDRHVVNYGNETSLTLLAIIDNETGEEDEPETLSRYFDVIKSYDGIKDWRTVRDLFSGDNAEGFVVKFKNNFRVKLKYESWFRLNFILNGLSKKAVLESLERNDSLNMIKMIRLLDEETAVYYKKMIVDFKKMYTEIEFDAMMEYKDFETDKEAAEYFKTCKYQSILFSIRKGKPYDHIIWKLIKQKIKDEQKEE